MSNLLELQLYEDVLNTRVMGLSIDGQHVNTISLEYCWSMCLNSW
jgi:hypothetical protein